MQNAALRARPTRPPQPNLDRTPGGPPEDSDLAALLAQCRPGWTLPGVFFRHPSIYALDLERVWRTGWLFAGHSCEIPESGDYLTLSVDSDSIIVIRGKDGTVRAWHNVCRHRGSLICTEERGRALRLVCPYHQWTYDPEGHLVSCRGMQPELDKDDFGLQAVAAGEVGGLIFISLARTPWPFAAAREALEP